MPGAHGPPGTWLCVGLEVRSRRADGEYEIATVLAVDRVGETATLCWRGGGVSEESWGVIWRTDPPLPVLMQNAHPLYMDDVAQSRTDNAQRLSRQYNRVGEEKLQQLQPYSVADARLHFALNVPSDVFHRTSGLPAPDGGAAAAAGPGHAGPPYVAAQRRIIRCPCGWNHIATPLVVQCAACACASHCVCVGLRAADPGVRYVCAFCEYGWAKPTTILPTPPSSPEGLPYRVPVDLIHQRFAATVVPKQRSEFALVQERVRAQLRSRGYELEMMLGGRHGPLDNDAVVDACAAVCDSAVEEGFFDQRYPPTAFQCLRYDACARVTLVRHIASGDAVAVLGSSGNECSLLLKSTSQTLRRALGDRDAADYLDLSGVDTLRKIAAVTALTQIPHLSLVATQAAHRKRGLGSMLMLHDLAGWAAEGRTKMYLNMTLMRRTARYDGHRKRDTPVFYYSGPSRRLYEGFGFHLMYPRKPCEKPHPRLPREPSVRCSWTDREVNNGVLMMNLDLWEAVQRAQKDVLPDERMVLRVADNPNPPPEEYWPEAARAERDDCDTDAADDDLEDLDDYVIEDQVSDTELPSHHMCVAVPHS